MLCCVVLLCCCVVLCCVVLCCFVFKSLRVRVVMCMYTGKFALVDMYIHFHFVCIHVLYMYCHSVPTVQHGESVCNLYGKIGGDSPLSHRGEEVSIHDMFVCMFVHVCVNAVCTYTCTCIYKHACVRIC